MSTIKVDTVRPVTADASLTLQGDSGGSGVTGLTIDSSGVFNTTTAKVTNIQATSGQSLTIKDEDGNAAITIGTDNTAAGYLSLNFGSYHGDSGGVGSGTLTANTLSDYETGSWTPQLYADTVTWSTSTQYGHYVKIGNLVTVQFYILETVSSGTASNQAKIQNLPFASANLNATAQYGNSIWTTATVSIAALKENNDSNITLWQTGTGTATVTTASLVSNRYLVGSISYYTV